MSVTNAQALSVILYLLPVSIFLSVRSRRRRTLDEIALDIPLAVAIDLLSLLLASRVVTLETATLVSRPLWVLGGLSMVLFRYRQTRRRPEWPSAVGLREILGVGAAIAFTLSLCAFISRRYVIWDSQWHTSIVPTLAVQKIPFVNALSRSEVLHYHFSGDVLAAVQRTLSFDVMSANRALASAHDLMFALTAATMALMVLAQGRMGWFLSSLAAVAVLFNGPIPLRGGVGFPLLGYEYHSFITLSYRPHVCLAGLLIVGLLGSVAVRLHAGESMPMRATAPVVMASVALLAVTDETSTALLGVGLGLTWLAFPQVLAPKRNMGIALLVCLGILVVASNLVFDAALAPGGPVQKITLSPHWRVASLGNEFPTLDLSTAEAKRIFLIDMLPLGLVWAALAFNTARGRLRSANHAFLVYSSAVIALAIPLALRVDINGDPTEAHRFFVAPFFVELVFAVLTLPTMAAASTEVGLALMGIGVPFICSVVWMTETAPRFLSGHKASTTESQNVFESNCRTIAGATLEDTAHFAYVEAAQFTRFVGCRPIFSPARTEASWATKITPLTDPKQQLVALERELPVRTAELEAICAASGGMNDPVCSRATRVRSSCRPEGTEFLSCPVTLDDRDVILGRKRN